MVSLAGAFLVSIPDRLLLPLSIYSLAAGFVLSLLGTIVLTFGMLVTFSGVFTVLVYR